MGNITKLEHREEFDNLTPYSFTYGDSSGIYEDSADIRLSDVHFGFMYDDLLSSYPEVCKSDMSISYIDLVAVLVKEVQDLRTRTSALESRVEELNRRVSELEDNDA